MKQTSVKNHNMDQHPTERLFGWKRIAKHLNCSERTARRWEAEEGLPIHRHHHTSRSGIYAFTNELDEWIKDHASSSTAKAGKSKNLAPGHVRLVLLVITLMTSAVIVWMSLKPQPDTDTHMVSVSSEDEVAIDLYQRGYALWQQRGAIMNQRAIKLLSAAVKQDPDFAEAWATLASAWLTYPTYNNDVALQETISKALLAADRAIELNPLLTQPRSVMASIAFQQGDWLRAADIFREALDGDPNNPTLLLWFAGVHRDLGMMSAAERLTSKALELDPNSPPLLTEVAMNKFHSGHTKEGLEALDYLWFTIGLETPVVWFGRWYSLINLGEYEQATSWIEVTPFQPFKTKLSAYVTYLQQPTTENRVRLLDNIVTSQKNRLPPWLAFFMLDHIDESDTALQILAEQSAQGFFDNSVVLFFPSKGGTRKSKQYYELLSNLGFVDYWQVHGAPDICQDEPDLDFCLRLIQDNTSKH